MDDDKKGAQAGKIQTVLGPIEPKDLGITLVHDHLLVDSSQAQVKFIPTDPVGKEMYDKPVSLETLWWVRYNAASSRDNCQLTDENLAIEEISHFKKAGGGAVVDPTVGVRYPKQLANISRATGLHVVMGSGYYTQFDHPADMDSKTEEEITDEIVRDLTEGLDGTGIRAGLIGEIGCSEPLAENEKKVLRAAAQAQARTGAGLEIHPGRKEVPHVSGCMEILDIVSKAGGNLKKTAICHIERTVRDPEQRRQLAETGVFISYDMFGWEGYHCERTVDLPNDNHRINEIMLLIEQGYINQIVVSQDICWKHYLRKYGGPGYEHILRNAVPVMKLKGMTKDQINTILIDNPRRLLTI